MLPLKLRKANPSDHNLIFKTWLRSYAGSTFANDIDASVYFSEHNELIKKVLFRVDVVCAVSEDDETQVIGWMACEFNGLDILHYMAVKKLYWKMGVGRMLIQELKPSFIYTHNTELFQKSFAGKNIYNPYLFYRRALCE